MLPKFGTFFLFLYNANNFFFLNILAKQILSKHSENLTDIVVILPNKKERKSFF